MTRFSLPTRTGLDLGAARAKLRVAAALADLNHLSAARPFTEARLLAVACGATAEQVERLVRGWRRVEREAAAAGEDGAQMCLARRGLSLRVDEDGMVVLRALEQVPAAAAERDTWTRRHWPPVRLPPRLPPPRRSLPRKFRLLGRPIRLFEPPAECLEGFLVDTGSLLPPNIHSLRDNFSEHLR